MGSDLYGLDLTGGAEAVAAYNRGVADVLRLRRGSVQAVAESIVYDPRFALGHAALALFGHEFCAQVDIEARCRDAETYAATATQRERSHVHAILRHLRGDSGPLVRHLAEHPRDALLLTTAVPTIAFAGVTTVPQEAWDIVERAAPAYGDDWWFLGLLAFIRQEQHRFDEAMSLSCRSLAEEPGAGHSAHARAHAHYETADHGEGLAWMDGWITGPGAQIENLSHFSWHAALHELSTGDLAAVRRRYETQLRPRWELGCRAVVDAGSLLWRWQITPDGTDVPSMNEVLRVTDPDTLLRPSTAFMAMHAAIALLALGDSAGLADLERWCAAHPKPGHRTAAAPLAGALGLLAEGRASAAADALRALEGQVWRFGGSDAQREIIEETRIHALLRAGRYDDAREVLDRRLDRRHCYRDARWRATAAAAARSAVSPGPAGPP